MSRQVRLTVLIDVEVIDESTDERGVRTKTVRATDQHARGQFLYSADEQPERVARAAQRYVSDVVAEAAAIAEGLLKR